MPNQSHSGAVGIPWHRCDRCGFEFRVSELTRQRGFILCYYCLDNPLAWERQRIISEVLSTNAKEPALADILKEPSQNDDDYYG